MPRPMPAAVPSTRRMLERPPTLDVVAGVERFVCLDICSATGGTKLSRPACAARYAAETKRSTGRTGATDGPVPHLPCVGCPAGAIHAGELRAGKLVQLQVVPGNSARAAAPRPAPVVFAVPEAVVPPRRPSRPSPKTPDPLHADAQQGLPAGNPADGAARSGSRERTSPAEIEQPAPPSGVQVSAGRRTPRMLRHPTTGEEMLGVEWAKKLGISHQLISWRIAKGMPMELVLAPYRHPDISAGVKAAKARGPIATTEAPSQDRTTVTCCDCRAVAARTSNRQLRCPDCRKRHDWASSRDAKREARRQAGVPERRGPVQEPVRPTPDVEASPPARAPERRVETPATPTPALDWIDRHYALAGLAVRVALTGDALRRATDEATEARRAYRDALRTLTAQGVP